MQAIRIGITTYGPDETNHVHLPKAYIESIRRAGAIPFLLPPGQEDIKEWLAILDAIVISGGGDINPDLYGGKTDHPMIYNVDQPRDDTEQRLIKAILQEQMPCLAICRGMQMVNVVLGGSLHEHLPDIVGENILHRLPERTSSTHEIELVKGSRLAKLLKTEKFIIASLHHQAVDKLGENLQPAAYAADGVVEAIEHKDNPYLLAVQWHPEMNSADDPKEQLLFDHLITLVKQKRDNNAIRK